MVKVSHRQRGIEREIRSTTSSISAKMQYKNLGKSGLKVSTLSFGAWVTFGNQLVVKEAKSILQCCRDHAVNFFVVDVLYCHRPDASTPIEETVRAMNYVIDKGWAFYWGTSEWSAQQITEAWGAVEKLDFVGHGLIPIALWALVLIFITAQQTLPRHHRGQEDNTFLAHHKSGARWK